MTRGQRCAAVRLVDALQLTASPTTGLQGPQGAIWGTRDEEGPLRYGMASRLVVMGPVGLVFYGVRITPSIAFPRQVLVIAQARAPCTNTTQICARRYFERGGREGNWHEILFAARSLLFPFCLSVFPVDP